MQTLFHKKKKRAGEDMSLQITSMADIFTILLVFLLKSYSSGINSISPGNGTTLPVATGAEITHDTLKLEVGRSSVLVDDKTVLNLNNYEVPVTEVIVNGMSQSVYKALSEQRQLRPEPNAASDLLVLADDETPYATLKTVLASAANSGFVDLQLVVVEND